VTPVWTLGHRPSAPAPAPDDQPDWAQCRPGWIDRALARALERPAGGWFVLDGSAALADRPRRYRVDGRDLVAWRTADGALRVGPDACPHLGASLSGGRVDGACVVCPWHGLALGDRPHGPWRPLPCADDGALLWVRMSRAEGALGTGEEPTEAPVLTARPGGAIAAAIRVEAACEPEDVLANRLDPWHGVHFHPHSFGRLRVIDQTDDSITVRVVYRVAFRIGIEVDARFDCPDRRTIAMTIVDGEGAGSVVETHATPIAPGRAAIIEATLATSGRRGFVLARRGSPAIRPLIRWAAHRLWRDDAAYAERRYAVRTSRR
jgi:isorenieratene synthase